MDESKIRTVLSKFISVLFTESASYEPFLSVEDGSEYDVWLVSDGQEEYVLKKAKEHEIQIYSCFFEKSAMCAPRFYESVSVDGVDYILIEYVRGKDLSACDRNSLIKVLDALIYLQDAFWEDKIHQNDGFSFDKSLKGRIDRGIYLGDNLLERAYAEFLEEYKRVPRTLCHDDLLPFNILVSDDRACLIDWEYGGILPYPLSLARLIAHGEEKDDALFYMRENDKEFAIDYYYKNFVKSKGISYFEYRHSLDLFLLYEYCEWIMLGNKYDDSDNGMLEKYKRIAYGHIKKCVFPELEIGTNESLRGHVIVSR